MGKRLIFIGADFSDISVDDQTIGAPVFSPSPGQYQNSASVTISSRSTGATIYYTTNGSTPNTSSSVYSSPIILNTLGSYTIKAIAVKNGVQSAVASATYEIVEEVIAPTAVEISGVSSSTNKNVQLTATVTPSGASQSVTWQVISGDATVSGSGLVTFNDDLSSSGDVTVRATASGHNNVYSDKTIHFEVPLSAPTISPDSGDVGSGSIEVAISAATGASIYYTLDGSTPTASSTLYTGPISISDATTLKAIAIRDGVTSDVAIGTYTIAMWQLGYYNFSTGEFTSNSRAFVCVKSPIKISDYTNLAVTLKAGWKIRLLFTNSSSAPLHQMTNVWPNGSETEDVVIDVNSLNTYNKEYLWINLCKWQTTSTASYVEITDADLATINLGTICNWIENENS